ncbi:gpW family head-tail joining protein [Brevundimonas subvibrioides]|uniref:Head-to-tail joining protein W gpW family protein n=1 Tax=Brevundimonas subvibrioides (strain ATCC 15264 / DSM 4735 / LMG 14903 / NBRC 16000 / CB 81) TaxID=633149 RepID=D9QFX6_BRESC|nr:gpW family head-tail joining protein [Brevundimonas subvibrioides]ADL00690.1 Head-to-tail joining protein W gpW family protein [Brevundimonas subvibrioides ATCC 15264]
MALTPEETAELVLLKSVRLDLISGQKVSKVTSGGRSVEFNQASLSRVEETIASLERRSRRRRGGAIGFTF